MTQLRCPQSLIKESIKILQDGGHRQCETVVLWLGRKNVDGKYLIVEQVYKPIQRVDIDYFHIPPESMRSLMGHLREHRLHILAQVHSHPQTAFHSEADDTWAIVRHEGALSIVVPYFAKGVTEESFFQASAVFRLSASNCWVEVPAKMLESDLEVIPC